MACEKPIRILNPKYKGRSTLEICEYTERHYGLFTARPPDYYIDVGCGKCSSCQKKRLQGFRMRLMYELQRYPESLFITLSFDDKALEEYQDNYNKAVLQFMDTVRKKYGKNVRHFFVMEYGSQNGRPHYHGILFNVPYFDFYQLESLWNRGNGRIRKQCQKLIGFYPKSRGTVFVERIKDPYSLGKYISKYLTKEYNPNKPLPRVLTSRGLGEGFLTPFIKGRLQKNKSSVVQFGECKVSLPRFYRDRIFTQKMKDKMTLDNFFYPKSKWIEDREFEPKQTVYGIRYPGYQEALKQYFVHRKNLGFSFALTNHVKRNKNINHLLTPEKSEFYEH